MRFGSSKPAGQPPDGQGQVAAHANAGSVPGLLGQRGGLAF